MGYASTKDDLRWLDRLPIQYGGHVVNKPVVSIRIDRQCSVGVAEDGREEGYARLYAPSMRLRVNKWLIGGDYWADSTLDALYG